MGKRRIIVGVTGASGLPLSVQCLKIIRESSGYESVLIVSDSAETTLAWETGMTLGDLQGLADTVFRPQEIGAGPASGSYQAEGMIIVPCSMKTLGGIHAGYAENLLLRAADVTIKEQRPLVLAVREAPLSPIHLRNMQELSMMPGVRIIPPVMQFYGGCRTVEEMSYAVCARMLMPFGIEAPRYRPWTGLEGYDAV